MLAPVKGAIGAPDDVLDAPAGLILGHADRHRQPLPLALVVEGAAAELTLQTRGRLVGPGRVGLVEQDDELLAAPTRDQIHRPEAGLEDPRQMLERTVAAGVAAGIVELPEVVHVRQQHGEGVAEALVAGPLELEALEEAASVAQAGQRIRTRSVTSRCTQM